MSGQPELSSKPFRPGVLYSFAYLGVRDIPGVNRLSKEVNVIIDSGGFTSYRQEIRKLAGYDANLGHVTLPRYIEFCQHLDVWGYVALDRIRDEPTTQANLDAMVAAGLTPIPVFVEGATWSTLPDLISINPRVCIAGAVYTADNYCTQRYQRAMQLTNNQILIHALGYGRWPHVLHQPISSSDSSTWVAGARFGTCLRFDKRQGMTSYRVAALQGNDNARAPLLSLLYHYNIPPSTFGDREPWWNASKGVPNIPLFTTALAYLSFSRHVWEKAGLTYFVVMNNSTVDYHWWAAMASGGSWANYVQVLKRISFLQRDELLAAELEIARAYNAGRTWGRS